MTLIDQPLKHEGEEEEEDRQTSAQSSQLPHHRSRPRHHHNVWMPRLIIARIQQGDPITKSDKQLLDCDESNNRCSTHSLRVLFCSVAPVNHWLSEWLTVEVGPYTLLLLRRHSIEHSSELIPFLWIGSCLPHKDEDVGFNSTSVGIKTFKSLPKLLQYQHKECN